MNDSNLKVYSLLLMILIKFVSVFTCSVAFKKGIYLNGSTMSGIYTSSFRQQDMQILLKLKLVRQIFDSYIICTIEKDFVIIDQHAAHERIQFEKLREANSNKNVLKAQYLIQPISISIRTSKEFDFLNKNMEKIQKFGFKSEFGPANTFIVRAVPTFSYRRVYPSFIKKLKDILLTIENPHIIESRILELIACHSAIKANRKLSIKMMRHLIKQLSAVKNPWKCPHGRPIIKELYFSPDSPLDSQLKHELDKQFKRI